MGDASAYRAFQPRLHKVLAAVPVQDRVIPLRVFNWRVGLLVRYRPRLAARAAAVANDVGRLEQALEAAESR